MDGQALARSSPLTEETAEAMGAVLPGVITGIAETLDDTDETMCMETP